MSGIIDLGNYKLFKQIGYGSFGHVYLTTRIGEPNKLYATKIIDINKFKSIQYINYFENELRILRMINHKNVIRLYDCLQMNNKYYFIMEYCNGGTLLDILKRYKAKYLRPFPQDLIQFLMRQIIEGIRYIHSLQIIHRDIKLDNILINCKDERCEFVTSEIKIIDFGLSKKLSSPNDLAISFVGNLMNMDPIILEKYSKAGGYLKLQGYNQKADIWSLGSICYEMLTGENIFKAQNVIELIKKVKQKRYSISLNYDLSNEIISFLNSMLQLDPNKRASAEELLKSDFLNKNVNQFTRINTQNASYVIKDGNIIMDFNNNNSLKIQILPNYLEDLLNDYHQVILYFDSYKL